MIDMECPGCQTAYRLKDEFLGRTVKCRVCQHNFEVILPDEDHLESIEISVPKSRDTHQKPISNTFNNQRLHKSRPKVDDLGFYTEYEDSSSINHEEELDEEDYETQLMREAAVIGSESLYEPRKKPVLQGGFSKRNATPIIPMRLVFSFLGLIIGCVLLVFLVISAGDRMKAFMYGMSADLYAEFSQPDDKPIGSPAPQSVKEYRTLKVRELNGHRNFLRDLIQTLNSSADIMAQVQDADSALTNGNRLKELGQGLQQRSMDQKMKLFNPNAKENNILNKEFSASIRKAMDRIRDENKRIASLPGFGRGYIMNMGQIESNFRRFEQMMGMNSDDPDNSNPDAYAEVRVAGLRSNDERAYVAEKIREVAQPKSFRQATNGLAASRYALWPVDSLSLLAGKLQFGKVIRRTGREIWVAVDSIDPAEIKAWKEAKEALVTKQAEDQKQQAAETERIQRESARRAQGISPQDPEIPANADDVTKGILLLKYENVFKRMEGLKFLKSCDLKGRDDEVKVAIEPILVESNPGMVRDAVDILIRCKTDGKVELIASKLLSSTNPFMNESYIKALEAFKDPSAIQPLIQSLKTSDFGKNAERALISFGQQAEAPLILALASPVEEVRLRACGILAEIGSEETIKAMKKLPADPSFRVRQAANAAMQTINNRRKLSGDKGSGSSVK